MWIQVTSHISFKKAYGLYFRVGLIFTKKTEAPNTQKLPPRENFQAYSIALHVGRSVGMLVTCATYEENT